VAASLLIGVAAASYQFFTKDPAKPDLAQNSDRPPPGTKIGAGDPRWSNWLPADSARLPSAPMPSEPRRGADGRDDLPPPVSLPGEGVAVAPAPRGQAPDLIGANPAPALPSFNLVQLGLPFLEPLADFDRDDTRQHLIDELNSEPAFRIDLFARNVSRGVELFQNAARKSNLAIHADALSLSALRKGQSGAMVIYTDSFNAMELTALFVKLNAEDAKVSPRVFDAVHAVPIGREDEVEIRRVLGTDPGLFKRALPPNDRRKELEKGGSVSAGTADQIVRSITAGKGGEASAVLLTWSPTQSRTPPAASAELKTFLGKRPVRKPNAVPVIIVIRHGNG
jgi:hypothetical protein